MNKWKTRSLVQLIEQIDELFSEYTRLLRSEKFIFKYILRSRFTKQFFALVLKTKMFGNYIHSAFKIITVYLFDSFNLMLNILTHCLPFPIIRRKYMYFHKWM